MATLAQIARELDEGIKAEGGGGFISDWAGHFDISTEQAKRIADRSNNAAEFKRIWETEGWWL
jgi:hypothetical protein